MALTQVPASMQESNAQYTGFKNRIINGAMVIDQRNAGAAVTINSTANTYVVDRWNGVGQASDGVFTLQQSSTAPAGFTKSLLATVTTADSSIGATQYYLIRQIIEGYNVADLGFGAAGASTFTLSFWVRSSVTGTFGGAATDNSALYCYPFSYTISAANTWEQKSITITGPTSGSTFDKTNGGGLNLYFSLGMGSTYLGTAGAWASATYFSATGSTNLISTNGATFYITGVQLEKGSTATSFDYRPYGTELALCQRYYEKSYNIDVVPGAVSDLGGILHRPPGTSINITTPFKVAKRASPSVTVYSPVTGTSSKFRNYTSGADLTIGGVSFIGMWAATPYSDASTANNQYGFQFVAESEL